MNRSLASRVPFSLAKRRPLDGALATRFLLGLAMSWLLVATAWAAPVGTAFTYQGSLDKSGVPGSGTCNFQFKLFNDPSAGVQIGPTLTPSVTLLENGQFSVTLDFGGAWDGNARWLEVAVQCPGDPSLTVLGPRQALTPAPYALYALAGPGGGGFALPYFGPVTSAAQDAFAIQNNATTGAFFAIHGTSATTATNTGGVLGEATAASGQVIGVFGKSVTSPNGIGVIGQGNVNGAFFEALNTTGDGTAVWGYAHTNASNAAGVRGTNVSTTGSTVGVMGVASASAQGTGVQGTGGTYGVSGSGADGVHGVGTNTGVSGTGAAFGVTGTSYGGFGVSGTYGAGITPASGTNAGVYGSTASTNGSSAGVRGEGTEGYGVEGISVSGGGVYGHSTSSVGVSGVSASYFGVLGVSGSQAGVKGISGSAQGVYGQSSAAGNGGVVGTNTNASGYGGWFSNNAGGVALYANGLAQVKTIQILGADLAESFPVREREVEPGTVVMIDDGAAGALRTCDEAYSHRVAGVVSGANGLDAAVVLQGKAFGQAGHASVAMSGRVWVKCDATEAPIRPGDLLTSAPRAGHAMRAADRERAYGAVLGKAMTSLEAGTGLVLVLVNLQ